MRSLLLRGGGPLLVSAILLTRALADPAPPSTPRLEQLTAAVDGAADPARALDDRGHAYALLGLKKLAVADLQRAVELAPESNPVLSRAGWSYFNLQDFPRALDLWLRAAALTNYARVYDFYTVALGYWATGEPVKAAAFYDRATALDEAFGEWTPLVARTENWTWAEKDACYRLFDAWRRGYRAQTE